MNSISRLYTPTFTPPATPAPATRPGGLLAMRNEDGETIARPSTPTIPAKSTVNLSEAPGGKPGDNYVGIRSKSSDGSTTLTQVRLQAELSFDGKNSKVSKIIGVGPTVSRNGKVVSERFKPYVVTDAKGQPITDIGQAKVRVAEMLKNGGMTTLTADQKQYVDRKTAVPTIPPKRTVNLSEAPGGKPSDNYVGIQSKGSDGSTTLTQVRLRAELAFDGKDSKISKITALGPVVSRDSKIVSERFKTYDITDVKGKIITNIDEAKKRVDVMLKNGGMTTLTAEQKQTMDRTVQARTDKRDKLTESLRKGGPLVLKAPGIDYSSSPNKPNRFLGKTPESQKIERGGWNVKSETDTPVKATRSALIVPNVVFEGGAITNKKGAGVSMTPQPLTGFFPYSFGIGDESRQQTSTVTWAQSTLHPAGFYPGDKKAAVWNKMLGERPSSVPEITTTSLGQTANIKTQNWGQAYLNIPNLTRPWIGTGVHARAIAERTELRTSAFVQNSTVQGVDSSEFAMAPYTWGQLHTKIGGSNLASAARGVYGKAGGQAEVGIYLYGYSTNVEANPPTPGANKATRSNKDWHIVNGKITEDRQAFLTQFASVTKQSDLYMLSESVVPKWNDRSAGVYVQVPMSPSGGTSSWQALKEQSIVSANRNRYVSVENMAKMLNKVGTEMPKYKEFRFVDADTLRRLNRDRISMVKDPKTGKTAPMFEAQAWINTSARVSVGGAGLFLPNDVKPGK